MMGVLLYHSMWVGEPVRKMPGKMFQFPSIHKGMYANRCKAGVGGRGREARGKQKQRDMDKDHQSA